MEDTHTTKCVAAIVIAPFEFQTAIFKSEVAPHQHPFGADRLGVLVQPFSWVFNGLIVLWMCVSQMTNDQHLYDAFGC